jgi:hypothetical protein
LKYRLYIDEVGNSDKADSISGLQIADLVAHPSFKAAWRRLAGEALPASFDGQIAGILTEAEYDHDRSGAIDGWGGQMAALKERSPIKGPKAFAFHLRYCGSLTSSFIRKLLSRQIVIRE